MKDELIDIYDSDENYVTMSMKSHAHKNGLWHRVFTGILVNPMKETIYLQKKTPGQYIFNRQDYLDVSVGGHYLAGEKIKDGVREIKEELGLDIKFDNLIPLGIRQTSFEISPNYKNNEFQHIFIIPSLKELSKYNINNTEVQGLVEIPVSLGLKLFNKEIQRADVKALYIDDEGYSSIREYEISLKDFVPAYLTKDELMKRLFIATMRWIRKEDTRYIYW